MTTRFVLACLAVVACGGGSASSSSAVDLPKPAAQKTFTIQLSRPTKVGERIHVVIDQREDKSTKTSRGDKTDAKQERKVMHFDAVTTVMTVDARGRAQRYTGDVKELTVDGKPILKGAIDITRAPKEKDAIILVAGAPATDEVRAVFQSLLKLGSGGASDDEIFGTKTPQPIGARWPMNSELAKVDLKEDANVDAASVNGETWLEGTTRVGDIDCLDVRAKMTLDGIAVPELPPGSTVESGHAEADLRTALPIDGRIERSTDHLGMKMSIRVRIPTPGGPTMLLFDLVQTRDAKFTAP